MIRHILLGLFFLGTFFIHAQTHPLLEELLDKHAQAMGGYERWANLETLVLRLNDGDGGIMEAYTKRPDKFKLVMKFMDYEWIKSYDGQTGWAVYDGVDKPMPAGEAREMAEEPYFFDELVQAREMGHDIKLLSKEKLDNKTVFKIQVTKAPDDIVTYYLNAQTFLLERLDETSHDPKWAGKTFTILFRDYQKWDGLTFPGRWAIIGATDQPKWLAVEDVIVNMDLEDSLFEKN